MLPYLWITSSFNAIYVIGSSIETEKKDHGKTWANVQLKNSLETISVGVESE